MRALVYLVSGSLLAMWIAPPQGIIRYGMIILMIVAAAYIDSWLRGWLKSGASPSNVVSLFGHQQERKKPSSPRASSRERSGMKLVFASQALSEADELLHLLRNEGLHAVLVTRNATGKQATLQFEIRLPQREAKRAQPLVELFKLRAAKNMN